MLMFLEKYIEIFFLIIRIRLSLYFGTQFYYGYILIFLEFGFITSFSKKEFLPIFFSFLFILVEDIQDFNELAS
jgi:hypothetical protein